MLGASAFTVSDKFRIRVFARDFAHYEQFLPGAPLAEQIADAVFAYVGDEYDWDMELAIPAGEVSAVRLGLRRAAWLDGLDGAELVEDRPDVGAPTRDFI